MPTRTEPRTRLHLAAFAALLCTTALVAQALPMGETVAKRPPVTEAPRIEVVFVLDTTGSMSGPRQCNRCVNRPACHLQGIDGAPLRPCVTWRATQRRSPCPP